MLSGIIYMAVMPLSIITAYAFVGRAMMAVLEKTQDEAERMLSFFLLICLGVFFVRCVSFLL
jgi:putative Mn2+ efflux pump MntP